MRVALVKDGGSALAAVLILTAALLLISGALLGFAATEQKIAFHHEQELKLYYLAEAGLEAGLAVLNADYRFRGPLPGELGGGSYTVEISPLPFNRRLVTATGYLPPHSRRLSLVAGLNPLLEKGLLVDDSLFMEEAEIRGSVHVNRELLVKGANRICAAEEGEGIFRYSGDPPLFLLPRAELWIGERRYTSALQMESGGEMKAEPVPRPALDFEVLEKAISCSAESLPVTIPGNAPLPGGGELGRICIEGDLLIAPEEGEKFNLDGLLLVRGDLAIDARRGGAVTLNGTLLVEGQAGIRGEINRGAPDKEVILVAGGDILIEDFPSPLFSGGNLLLYSPGEVKIDSGTGDQFEIRGAIIAGRLRLERCRLHCVPEMLIELKDFLPDSKAVVKEWIRP